MHEALHTVSVSGGVGSQKSLPSEDGACALDLEPAYQRVEMALLGNGDGPARVVALCAEPGSGRHEALAWAAGAAERNGMRCVRRDLRGVGPVSAAERAVRAARSAVTSELPVLVVLEGVPPADENVVARIARALTRASDAGAPVIFSVDPEARQLVDELPNCIVLTAADLAARPARGAEAARSQRCMHLTRGIPCLVRALGSSGADDGDEQLVGGAYYDALGVLASAAVRPSLSDEERRVRLAMVLLGRGNADELGRVAGVAAGEVLDGLVDCAPLFGVSARSSSFDCLSAVSPKALAACLQRIEAACALFPDVAERCLSALVGRGELERAAAVGSLPECAPSLGAVLERGPEFLDAGEVALVRKAAELAPGSDEHAAPALAGVGALGSRFWREPRPDDGGAAASAPFVEARRFLRGLPALPAREAQSDLERRLWAHRGACDLMLQGRYAEAMRLVISAPRDRSRASLSVELLDLDLGVARLMSGEAPESLAEDEHATYPLLSGGSAPGLSGYLGIARLLRVVIGGGGTAREAEALAARAERSGEVVPQVVALLAGCVIDLRSHATTRAHVRAQLAASLAVGSGMGHVERVARLLAGVASYLMGERGGTPSCREQDDLGAVCALVGEAMGADDSPVAPPGISDHVPWDALWLLRIVGWGLGDLSARVERATPPSWRRALRALAAPGEGAAAAGARRSVSAPAPDDATSGRAPIEVDLLGGFAVRVRGVRIPDWKLERRNARSMLVYMVLERGNSLKRFRLVDQVWPACDYVTGFNRAYQATSVLRRAIAEIDPMLDPFVTSRSGREITLDMGLVACDVDEFRRVAREASDGDRDEEVLLLARRAESLYQGDLCVPPVDATGYVAATRAELRDLYADAMVAGAAAALRLGHERTSARLAHNALIANELREDAMAVLVRALRDSGRSREAERRYAAFSARLSGRGAGPSSRALEEAARGLGEGAGGHADGEE